MTSITEFYKGKQLLITGATGFMGKVLVEKLLRECSDLESIYMLVRPKRGKDPQDRLNEFIQQPIFDLIRKKENSAKLFSKIICIAGDITEENLGLSNDDDALLQNKLDIIFHVAANVRFDQPLKTALLMNTGGTLKVLELASRCKKLDAFIHVSTSYCHCDETILEEKIYKAPHDPRKMLDLASWMDEELLTLLTPKLLKSAPNTYAYTKCLTEQLVSEYASKFSICIARPSIVTSSLREPIPGWVDNFNGPTGLMIGAGKGVIRTMHCNPDLCVDIVPVDMAINALIVIAKDTSEKKNTKEVSVVHITAARDNPITWQEAIDIGKKHFLNYPFSICLWYPGGGFQSNYLMFIICAFFYHWIPAYLIDFLMRLTRNKPFLVQTQKRISTGLDVLRYYTVRDWYFKNDKIKRLVAALPESEKSKFNFDLKDIDYSEYILNSVLGARQYCVKEKPDTLPQARKLLKRLYILDISVKIILGFLFVWMISGWVSLLLNALN